MLKKSIRSSLRALYWKIINIQNYFQWRKNIKKKYGMLSNREIFSMVYKEKDWNKGSQLDFDSGPGSHDPDIVAPYVETITNFLKSQKKDLSVIDLGCGDFNIGSQLYQYTEKYIAIDVVDELIIRNNKKFKSNNLKFVNSDIVRDELPLADCVLIKEVLQHLTNSDIKIILNKVSSFKYIIITESLPLDSFMANKDKFKGPNCRIDLNSGVVIEKPPFNFQYKIKEELLKIPREDRFITTILYENN